MSGAARETPVELTFVGSGDAFGSGGRLFTCLHVRHPEGAFLIDCGATALPALRREGVAPGSIDAVLLTHFHGDHFGGLPWLLIDGGRTGRTCPLAIAGPPGVAGRVREASEILFPGSWTAGRDFEVSFAEWGEEPVRIGALRALGRRVVHAPGSEPHAVRVEVAGRTIAYTGDTEWTESLVEVARGADLLVAEAWTHDRAVPLHLDHATLVARREELGCARIVCTHMGPEMLERESTELERAEDGRRIEL